MLLPDQAIAERAETILEAITFFLIPVVLIATDTVPFHQRYVLLIAVTTVCVAVYLTRPATPTLSLTRRSLTWLIPATATVMFIATTTAFNVSYDSRLAAYALLVSATQEFLFREYLQKRLTQAFNAPTSIACTSLVFAVIHIIYADPLTAFTATLLFSLIVSTAYHYSDNLVLASLIHAEANYLAINTCLIAIPGTC
mgnify:CR=1 FL=1